MLGIALMQLDSVRSLKQDIVSTVLPKLVERLPTAPLVWTSRRSDS